MMNCWKEVERGGVRRSSEVLLLTTRSTSASQSTSAARPTDTTAIVPTCAVVEGCLRV